MSHNMQRVESAAQVDAIAAANHVPRDRYTHTRYAASVALGEVVYFWAA